MVVKFISSWGIGPSLGLGVGQARAKSKNLQRERERAQTRENKMKDQNEEKRPQLLKAGSFLSPPEVQMGLPPVSFYLTPHKPDWQSQTAWESKGAGPGERKPAQTFSTNREHVQNQVWGQPGGKIFPRRLWNPQNESKHHKQNEEEKKYWDKRSTTQATKIRVLHTHKELFTIQ